MRLRSPFLSRARVSLLLPHGGCLPYGASLRSSRLVLGSMRSPCTNECGLETGTEARASFGWMLLCRNRADARFLQIDWVTHGEHAEVIPGDLRA
jgi:hypothetical protein